MKRFILLTLLVLSSTCFAYNGSCSGAFVSSDGYIMTAAHCQGKTMDIQYFVDGEHKVAHATIVAVDKKHDIMLLHIPVVGHVYWSVAPNPTVGDKITAYGYPLPDQLGFHQKITHGEIREIYEDGYISTYLWMGAGISGGGVIRDSDQKLIGLCDAIWSSSGESSTDSIISNGLFIKQMMDQYGVYSPPESSSNVHDKNVFILISF